ncbi:amino acid transporter, putative [Entamoeba dispar SAW760]|uniref:Amino acid transporter, putative n=1 Tax=Entamoeba dispar (strain ATCC PRA-260 / SAW760) TaxID=370354 RepID=B0EMB0_ENTDS|nr:amino acid transporter, putative [Entamoeba dispar SAW760]EDR24328.1 amino acid transporter, putative [Entamoeba dispar SAW760]|eukprot:EDR24328.1 amino acid transporter, putative [Entamoeba dispar SAW760]
MNEQVVLPKRELGVISLLAMMYVSCIGGAYGTEPIISSIGPMCGIILMYLLPFFVQFPMCLFTAEMSLSIPSNAGYITWYSSAYGSFGQFITPFVTCLSLFSTCLDCAVYPTLFVSYVSQKFITPNGYQYLMKISIILFGSFINFIGVKCVGVVSIMIIVMVILPFILFIFTAIPFMNWRNLSTYLPYNHIDFSTFFSVIFWNLNGVENAANVIEEVKNPTRNIPLSLFLLVVLTSFSTATPLMAGVGLDYQWPNWKEGSFIHVSELLQAGVWGKIVSWLLFIGALLTSTGLLLNGMCFTARRLQGIANLGINDFIKKLFGRNNKYFGTPDTSILLTMIITIGFAFTTTFNQLVGVSSALSALFLIGDFITFFVLRIRFPYLDRPFKAGPTWLMILLSSPSILFCLFTVFYGITTDLTTVIVALTMILCSFIVSFFFALFSSKQIVPHQNIINYLKNGYKPLPRHKEVIVIDEHNN